MKDDSGYFEVRGFARDNRRKKTAAESVFWRIVRNRRFHNKKFSRQRVIHWRDGHDCTQYYIADFYCHEHRLIVELDGSSHIGREASDRLRDERLGQIGYHVFRIQNDYVLDHWEMVEWALNSLLSRLTISPLFQERGWG